MVKEIQLRITLKEEKGNDILLKKALSVWHLLLVEDVKLLLHNA